MGRFIPRERTGASNVQSPRTTGCDSVFGSAGTPLELSSNIMNYADSLVRE